LTAVRDRATIIEVTTGAMLTGDSFDCDVCLYGHSGELVRATIIGRVDSDASGKRKVYMIVMLKGVAEQGEGDEGMLFDRTVTFDYAMGEDKLSIRANLPDGTVHATVIENWVRDLDLYPNSIDSVSAVKMRALVRDLRHHPLTGFIDLKCNLRGGEDLRWYHINYLCESDDEGNTTVLHGYAQDAHDEMGSVKWWRDQAERCQLTGLLNRNAAEQKINLLMHRHKGGIMFMIDLDGFKRVNDQLGHMVGDDLLRRVGKVLSSCFRENDALGRYGGDEFVALVPAPATGDLQALAQQRSNDVIEAISQIEIPDGTHAACSVGAVICQRDASFYDLLEKADKVLYESKTSGKGKTTIATM
jgi:diguanylate cyclase (GGDEF)-like protein